jgi:hypothetical protein
VLALRVAAEVVFSERRICANYEQIITFVDPLVPGPSGQDRDVARLEFECPTSGSTEAHSDAAASDPKHLMNLGVIVDVIIDAVPPGVLPTIALEQDLKQSRGIGCPRGADWPAVQDQRQFAIVWNNAVVDESKDVRVRGRSAASTSRRFGRRQPVIFSICSLMVSMRGMCTSWSSPFFNASP